MSSIYKIANQASMHRKRNPNNAIIKIAFFVIPFLLEFFLLFTTREKLTSFISALLGLNGAILGLAIAGFSISNVIPKELMAFMASSKAKGYPWSNYKTILINYVYCFVALFSSISLFVLIYVLLMIPVGNYLNAAAIELLKPFTLGAICLIQGWVLVELKIFLFWIYDNSLLLGQAVAESEGLKPFDE